ncbi:MAG: hypothetical protein ACWA47_07885 [Brevirhabdus sp.]
MERKHPRRWIMRVLLEAEKAQFTMPWQTRRKTQVGAMKNADVARPLLKVAANA